MYSVTVKIEGIESGRRSAGLLHIVIGFLLVLKVISYSNYVESGISLPTLLVGSISIFYGFFRRRVDVFAKYNAAVRLAQLLIFIVLGIALQKSGRASDTIFLYVFAVLCFFLLITERKIFKETTIFFNDDGVMIPGNYKDYLVRWEDLSEVVVREDFLTLFHIKKKYLQYQVMQDLSTLEVAKLNAFCREKIESTPVKEDQAKGG